MTTETSRAKTGVPVLDTMLRGGLPRRRAVLVAGGPGTGKSTLAMQFLQAGLDAGEDCFYVSTEQTIDELRDSFEGFAFDLDHEALSFASIHATPGRPVGSEDRQLTLSTLDDDEVTPFGDGFDAPFTAKYVHEYLDRYGPFDRVAFDSVSGLAAVAETDDHFRRSVLDLIRQFTDDAGATSLFTAEAHESSSLTDTLRFTTHGVIELGRRRIADDPHLAVEVSKMRGVDHDRRRAELQFTDRGLRAGPARRSKPPALKDHTHRSIGVDGLDALCGGGPVCGAGVLLEHDGTADLTTLLAVVLADAFDRGEAVTLLPTIDLGQRRMDALLDGWSVEELLADDRLFVVDAIGGWDESLPNVHPAPESAAAFADRLTDLYERTDRTQSTILDADATVHTLGAGDARTVRYATEANLVDADDRLLHVTNPGQVDDSVTAFYRDAAEQVIETWMEDDGLQYLRLKKSPCGFVGSTSLVEYLTEPPYLEVQSPPGGREDPGVE
jgi:KaiC/GvpD/RAD55 family RecA-like ATPase